MQTSLGRALALSAGAAVFALGVTAQAETLSLKDRVFPDATYRPASVGIQSTGDTSADDNFLATGQNAAGNDADIPGPRRTLYEWDLTAVADAITASLGSDPFKIDSVQLVLQANFVSALGENFTLQIRSIGNNADFDKNTVTWNNAPNEPGGTEGTLLAQTTFQGAGPLQSSLFDVTFGTTDAFEEAVKAALDGPDDTIRFMLLNEAGEAVSSDVDNFVRFTSNNSSTPDGRPELIISFSADEGSTNGGGNNGEPPVIPLPVAAWPAVSMLLGMGVLAKLKKARRA
jgi:hypothetical protein